MWEHGDEPLAKALIGHKLMKSMMKEAKDDFLEMELHDELKKGADLFKDLAYDLLEQCYQVNDDLTMRLLTYELKNWSRKNCISLAALANHKKFIAHPCCQLLLGDLWLGGLRVRKNVNLKILMAVLLPPMILTLTFKTREELLLQAQTAEEHHENVNDDDASDSESDSGESVYDTEMDAESCAETPSRDTLKGSYFLKFRSRRLSLCTDPRLHLTDEVKTVDTVVNKGCGGSRRRSRKEHQMVDSVPNSTSAVINKSASASFPISASSFRCLNAVHIFSILDENKLGL
ncbi:unnamed protein product [Soboliphyme baturini]|uniref:BTB/POZ domain-containing protein n=1 Tax=Soboliphyme baturini TaxID=241478 RepID=A0A183I932_9BILA|nr:unnamed protein product [Soboliphyme baturini]